MNDLKFAIRQLLKNRGFTFVAILTLALGIGVNTSIFTVLNTTLLGVLPYPNSEQLVSIFRTSTHSQSWPHSPGSYSEYRDQTKLFEQIVAYTGASFNIADPGEPAEQIQGLRVTADFFPALKIQPALGRVFTREEDQAGASEVVVLTDPFWRRRFGGDPGIIGRTLRIDGQNATVIGVMPPGFEHPLLWGRAEVFRPIAFSVEERQSRANNYLQMLGRIKPGASLPSAQAELLVIATRLAAESPQNKSDRVRIESLQHAMIDEVGRSAGWFAGGLAGVVLLIACANLANLQLVRTASRVREFALRKALGAQPGRLVRQLLMESLVLASLGGALGLLLAFQSNELIGKRIFNELPGVTLALDWRVFSFALACSLLTGVIFGTVPALLGARVDVNEALKDNLRGTTGGRSQHHFRNLLIIGEVAFALVLLTAAGLFIRGLGRFANLDPGWRVDGLVMAQLSLKGTNYARSFQRRAYFAELEQRLAQLPGVQKVGISASSPIWGFSSSGPFVVEGQPEPAPGQFPEAYRESVNVDYFTTLGLQLREGRTFTANDTTNSPRVIVINTTMARRFWPGQSAVGKRIGSPDATERDWLEIVGVVEDIRFPGSLGQPYSRLQSYVPMGQSTASYATISMRAAMSEGLPEAIRRVVAGVDPDQPVREIRTARGWVARSLSGLSFLGTLLGIFAALGVVLAGIGIYGVISYSVLQRVGEIGIRMALGAQRRDVLWLILSKGLLLSLFGGVIGWAGAFAAVRALASAIPSLPISDPAGWIVLTLLLVGIALLACYVPARRATKIDPMEALRYE